MPEYKCTAYRIAGKFGELTLFEHLAKEVWQINRSANRLLIVSTNLDGFSLANHERFAKLSRYMVDYRVSIHAHSIVHDTVWIYGVDYKWSLMP